MSKRPHDECWSRVKFPNEKPPQREFNLWKRVIRELIPSTGTPHTLGPLKFETHKLWPWRHSVEDGTLLHIQGDTMDVYKPTQLSRHRNVRNRWTRLRINQPTTSSGERCTVREVAPAVVAIDSTAPDPPPEPSQDCFLDVLREWGCTWMWKSMRVTGDDGWLQQAIEEGTIRAVTDGSYIRELCPSVCSAAFVLECSKGRGRIIGSFPEQSPNTNAYRAELLGLLAIHLVLLAICKALRLTQGHVSIFSDCVGALSRTVSLPKSRVPSRCKHADILKNLMIQCKDLPISREYFHVRGHQDDRTDFDKLSRPAQLNCFMDHEAKSVLWGLEGRCPPRQEALPLEPVTAWVGKHKLNPSTSDELRFWVHQQIAKEVFVELKLMDAHAFDEVAWREIFKAMHTLPRLFQIWACKQVTDIAGTNKREYTIKKRKKVFHDPRCPSCASATETCAHVLTCREAGRVEVLNKSVDLLEEWLTDAKTETSLKQAICRFARGRGQISMAFVTFGQGSLLTSMAASQDSIGWLRFMKGMISKEMMNVQSKFCEIVETKLTPSQWAQGLSIKLMEVTHGQWLYRNVHVHDKVTGTLATKRKEDLKEAILDHLYIGEEGLAEEDKYLLEINLDDLENTSGIKQRYWLLAIRAARKWQELQTQEERRSIGTCRVQGGRA